MKIFNSLIVTGLLFSVMPSHAVINIFTCEPEWASLSKELGADKMKVYSATTARQDVHHIQARPSLIAKMRRADLVVCTGAELEAGWLPLLLQRAANAKVQPGQPGYFMAAEQVERLDIPGSIDRSMGDIHASGNPHVHLDPERLLSIARVLSERLVQIDASGATIYRERLQDFQQRWSDAMARWRQRALPLKGLGVVVHHRDWRYLLEWLEMQELAALEPKPGIPPTASHLAKLKDDMAQRRAAMILRAAYQDARPSQWLAQKTGIPAVELPYSVGGNETATDLFSLFDDTLARIIHAAQVNKL